MPDSFAVLNAVLSRAIGRNPEPFRGVENLLDKEYAVGKDPSTGVETIGAPRLIHGGVAVRF